MLDGWNRQQQRWMFRGSVIVPRDRWASTLRKVFSYKFQHSKLEKYSWTICWYRFGKFHYDSCTIVFCKKKNRWYRERLCCKAFEFLFCVVFLYSEIREENILRISAFCCNFVWYSCISFFLFLFLYVVFFKLRKVQHSQNKNIS